MNTLTSLYFLDIENYMLPCFTKQIWGFDCPGCGLQRAFVFLFTGEFGAAFEIYPAIYPMILLLGYVIVDKLFSLKFSSVITITLTLFTVGTLITNYILKFI